MNGYELRLWAVVMVPQGPTTGISRSQAYQHQMKEKKTKRRRAVHWPSGAAMILMSTQWWDLQNILPLFLPSFLPQRHLLCERVWLTRLRHNTSGLTCYTTQAQLPCKQILSTWGDQLHLMEWSKETDVCGQSTINAWFHVENLQPEMVK